MGYINQKRYCNSAETLKHTVNFVDSFTNDKIDSLTNGKRDDSGVTKKEDNKNVQKVDNEIDNKQHEDTEKPASAPERIPGYIQCWTSMTQTWYSYRV